MITVYFREKKTSGYEFMIDCSEGINGYSLNWFCEIGYLLGERYGGSEERAILPMDENRLSLFKRLGHWSNENPEEVFKKIEGAISLMALGEK